MPEPYLVYGAEPSPYSVKVRSYFRYKGLPHRWILRTPQTEADYKKLARLPIIPLVVTPEGLGIQDSTPILDRIESEHPKPSVHPEEPVARFVSVLLEEFGDEWGNKWMFHFRWAREVDQLAAAARIARTFLPADASDEQLAGVATGVRGRMVGRVWFVGSSEATAPQIEGSFREAASLLDAHLATRPYLFGERPAYGDFGLWGQLYELWTDPTPCAFLETCTPHLLAWIQRMCWPRAEGGFEPWESLAPTLEPLLARQVGRLFLPWTLANEACVAAGKDEFSVELAGCTWTQKPQKYHAKSLRALREKYAAVSDRRALDPVLARTGCLAGLQG